MHTASERSDRDGPPVTMNSSRSRRRGAGPAPELDDLGLLVCDDDLALIAGEVDFHATAMKNAVMARSAAAACALCAGKR